MTKGQEARIWYGEDLKGSNKDNNEGTACVDVYAKIEGKRVVC